MGSNAADFGGAVPSQPAPPRTLADIDADLVETERIRMQATDEVTEDLARERIDGLLDERAELHRAQQDG